MKKFGKYISRAGIEGIIHERTMTCTKKSIKTLFSLGFTVTFLFLMTATIIPGVNGVSAVDLGSAGNYAILSQTGITDTDHSSAIKGDIGTSRITSADIQPYCSEMKTGTIFGDAAGYVGDGITTSCFSSDYTSAGTAVTDMKSAYDTAQALSSPDYIDVGNSGDIGGKTLGPGLYKFTTAVTISSDVTLNGNSGDVWIFQIPGTFDISSGKHVLLSGGAQVQNVFWVVGGATTLGTTSGFNGTILDSTAITMNTGATLNGRALAQSAVTMDGNTVTIPTMTAAAPVASFTGTPITGTAPLTVVFTDTSTGSPASWSWNFGDSDTTNSTMQNPVHTFATAGLYTVALTAANAGGPDTATHPEYITVSPAAPVVSFNGTPTTGVAPLTVVFTDSSTGSPASWSWDFGDSDTTNSTMQNPVHAFATAGLYTVALTAANAGGPDTATHPGYITVSPAGPVASFTVTPATGTAPLTVVFTDTSTGSPTSWSWDFGDSDTTNSSVRNPVHTYTAPGLYTVNLTDTNGDGADTKRVTGAVTVNPATFEITLTNVPVWLELNPGATTTNTTSRFTVNSNTNWQVTAKDTDGTTLGYMTSYSVSGNQYKTPAAQLSQPFKVMDSSSSYVALPSGTGAPVIFKTGTAEESGTAYPIGVQQEVRMTDPALPGGNVYRIVVTLTVGSI
jgi:PKD repeat protein